jgi:GAF domain-containing protein
VSEDGPQPPADQALPALHPDLISELAFPQVARLELDELLEQLVARARDVQDTQGRLCGLLRANLEVARGVDLEEVLRHIVDAACELVHARYAAIGVVRNGHLVRFVHTGMSGDEAARVGGLPEGKGVLGLLVERPQRLRLRDIAEHVCSVGFPEHHPPMRSFLGVPVRVRDQVFGNLYLAGKQGADEFTAEDEELVAALAAAAGVAIENANLFIESRRRQQWQAAMVEMTTQLLTGSDPDEALRQMVRHALAVSDADSAGVTVPTDDPELLRVAAAEGGFGRWQGEVFPLAGSASAIAMAGRRAVLVAESSSDPRVRVTEGRSAEPGATVVAPIASDRGAAGALIVSKSNETGAFDAADLDMIGGFAGQAALALELAEARRDNERLRLLEDRQRIGEDLQHSVIQRLFALGLSIQAMAVRVGDSEVKRLITDRVEEIDDIIRDIRATVFALRSPRYGA